MDPQQMLEINQAGWDVAAPKFVGATALPDYGPFAPSEDDLQLLGNLAGQRVLELGCGSGHSLILEQTIANVASYLRPQGRFIFSWEHPFYRCLQYEAGQFVVTRSYQTEGSRLAEGWNGVPLVRFTRKLSTYLNALAAHGLVLERLLEPAPDAATDDPSDDPARYYSHTRAVLVPATFIVDARKR